MPSKKLDTVSISLYILLGILIFFVLEKIIHWRHCHTHGFDTGKHAHEHDAHHPHSLAPLNLVGDAVHNFLDGLIVAVAYMVSIPAGIATTIAVLLHEVPQEIADFGVLIYAGMKKAKALLFNYISAAFAILGALIAIFIGNATEHFINIILPIGAGGFIYIAGSALIPELHKECTIKESALQLLMLIIGIGLMVVLTLLE